MSTVSSDLCMSFSDLMGALSQSLNHTEQTLVQVEDLDSAAHTKLDSVKSDAEKLERTVHELLDHVEFIKNSDIRGEESQTSRSAGLEMCSESFQVLKLCFVSKVIMGDLFGSACIFNPT